MLVSIQSAGPLHPLWGSSVLSTAYHDDHCLLFCPSLTSATHPPSVFLGIMSATEVAVPPQHPPSFHQEVIDVDALDDDNDLNNVVSFGRFSAPHFTLANDGLAYMGFTSANSNHRGSLPTGGAQAGPSTRRFSNDIIILESDDEDVPSSSNRPGRSSSTFTFFPTNTIVCAANVVWRV